VEPEAADCVFVRDFAAPPPVVWEWLNDPHKRTRWMRGRAWSAGLRPLGRTREGASNHCSHGLGQVIETVLDWRPFSYFTVRIMPPSGNLTLLQTYQLEPLPNGGGTRLSSHVQVQTRLPRWLTHRVSRWAMLRLLRHDWANLARLMAEETPEK
ncbi:MAG: SRPBCC family protein, partial [Anaerolineales bacterium]